ncbi:hypothetical protein [Haloferula sp. BvORR071]|uniref:hypothetical protein n=1 Tax=Haloferula sp. BvORR071 TaxID=1396141 RepID=UPI002240F26D|nr:hypothetical protein [Haloferula sp. BvORR071]
MIFWFGLLVLAFISIAWVDSNFQGTNFRRHLFGTQFIVVHGQNRVLLWTAKGPAVGVQNVFDRGNTPAAKNWAEIFRSFRAQAYEVRNPATNAIESENLRLTLPHWLAGLVAVGVWVGLLVWRGRRFKGLTQQNA